MKLRIHREILQNLVAIIIVLLLVAARAFGQDASNSPLAQSVDRIEITVADMDRAAKFFCEVLEFEVVADELLESPQLVVNDDSLGRVRQVDLKLGDEMLRLTSYLDAPGKPMPADSRGNDRWFQHVAIIVSDMDRAYQKLRRLKVRHASSAPQTLPEWNKNAAGIKAFYFRDPDGHFLEILQFPPDKGNAKWHRDTNKLFLGIDHTAIVVADMDESLKFYRDKLGMRVVGNSENFGFEQEHLNGVFGAHLLITTLHADQGPGVELLEYLSPTDGREAASDTRPNDVAHWTIHLAAAEVPPIATKFGAAPARAVSREASAATAFELLDPDRHAVSISSAKGN